MGRALTGALGAMCIFHTPQQRMDAAFDNYLALSRVLREDMHALIAGELDDPHWRRNFVRSTAALIEGYGHCFREMCAISFKVDAPSISRKEKKAILEEGSFSTAERTKLTLRAAFKLFELSPQPNFGGTEWTDAVAALAKRDALMHPREPSHIQITDLEWQRCRAGLTWLLAQLFSFLELLQEKHGA